MHIDKRLKTEHVDFLVGDECLRQWSGFSLKDRAHLFHRRFIDAKITASQLRSLYRKFGIKKKKVRMVKHLHNPSKEKWPTTPESILEQLDKVKKDGRMLFYIDEVFFTKHVNQDHDWSRMHSNTVVDKKHAFTSFLQTTAAINYDIGVAFLYTLDHACKNEEFLEFAERLREQYSTVPITFFADNLSQHHAAEDELRKQLDI